MINHHDWCEIQPDVGGITRCPEHLSDLVGQIPLNIMTTGERIVLAGRAIEQPPSTRPVLYLLPSHAVSRTTFAHANIQDTGVEHYKLRVIRSSRFHLGTSMPMTLVHLKL